MSRWIEADVLKKRVEDSNKSAGLHLEDLRKIRRWIKTAPSIDIVRCKECKHWLINSKLCKHWSRYYGSVLTNADDFCSYGERKESE